MLPLGDSSLAVFDYLDPPNLRVTTGVDFNFTQEISQSPLAFIICRGRVNVSVNHHLNPSLARFSRAGFKLHVEYVLV